MKKSTEINWKSVIFLTGYQLILLIALPFYLFYGTLHWGTIIASTVLLYLTGLSITAGYHRYFAHRSYKTNRFVEYVLLFFGTMSCQASVLRWGYDHRIHHACVDTDDDPYSINKGFWYAHCLWLIEKPKPIDPKVVSDLLKNPAITFQDKYYPWLMLGTNLLAFVTVGWLTNDWWGALVLSLMARMFLLHHFTWFINSLAHTWGDRSFCQEQSAVDNYIISLLTFGEGYHNYHHTFANDYRNGIRWYHFDPTKWLVWTLEKLGLAKGLKRMDPYTIKKRMVIERKNLLLEQIQNLWQAKKEELEPKIMEISERIIAKISDFSALKERYQQLKQDYSKRDLQAELKREIKEMKKSLKEDWQTWKELSRNIMRMKSLKA